MSDPTEPWKWGDEGKPKPYKKPTGRHLCCGMDAEMRPFADGDWVPYSDYARLKSEVESVRQVAQDNKTETEATRIENARLKTELAKSEEHNAALCERLQDLNAELHTASCANANAHKEINRLKAMESLKTVSLTDSTNWQAIGDYAETKEENARLKAEVERLKGIILAQSSEFVRNATKQEAEPLPDGWNSSVAKACDLLDEKEKEIARLKTEVEEARKGSGAGMSVMLDLNNKLVAEVERLKTLNTIDQRTIQGLQQTPEWSEIARLTAYCRELEAKVSHLDLFKSVVEKFFNSADLKNLPDAQSCYALAGKLKQLPDSILDFTEEQVRDNPAWALAVFRHKVKEMQYKRIHDLNAIGGEQEENARLKAEAKRSTDQYNGIIDTQLKVIDELKAEVERLRKAGDELAWAFSFAVSRHDGEPSGLVKAWNAAKEGKQS